MTARVASVNVGRPRPVDTGRRVVETAIWKQPVAGRVAVRGVNVDGDDQADRTVHGGPDKAVYAYALEEIRQLGGRARAAARRGRLRREPDDRGHRRLGRARRRALADRDDAARGRPAAAPVLQARPADGRPGVPQALRLGRRGPARTCGSSTEGELGAGDAIEVDLAALPDHGVSMRLLSDALLLDDALIPQALAAPQLIPSLRDWLAARAA